MSTPQNSAATDRVDDAAWPEGEQCDAVRDRIRAGAALNPRLQAHAARCGACTAMHGLTGTATEAGDPAAGPALDGVAAALDQQLAADRGVRSWLSQRPTPVRLRLAFVGALIMPLLWLLAAPRADLGVYPKLRFGWDLALLILPTVLIVPLVLRPLSQPARAPWVRSVLVAVAVVATMVLVSAPAAHGAHPASLLGIGDDLGRRAMVCFVTGVVSGLPMLAWIWALSRRDVAPWHLGALGAMVAAMVGGLAVFLHCPLTHPVHLTAGHATVLLPFIALAWWGRERAG